MIEFKEFPKIPRLTQGVTCTEKLDGTNACVVIGEDGSVAAQSRSRLITPEADNYGFARWVSENQEALQQLGPGRHYGEWWGAGIQRKYGLAEKRFSLFNAGRWHDRNLLDGEAEIPGVQYAPLCCHVVPVLTIGGLISSVVIAEELLRQSGSIAAPGFMQPEGFIVYMHGHYFKYILDSSGPKSLAA